MNGHASVLVVTENKENCKLISNLLTCEGIHHRCAHTLDEVEQAFGASMPAMGIVDCTGQTRDTFSICDCFHKHLVAFVLLLPAADPKLQMEAVRRGARIVLKKPVRKRELMESVRILQETGMGGRTDAI